MDKTVYDSLYSKLTLDELIEQVRAHRTGDKPLDKLWYDNLVTHILERNLSEDERSKVLNALSADVSMLTKEKDTLTISKKIPFWKKNQTIIGFFAIVIYFVLYLCVFVPHNINNDKSNRSDKQDNNDALKCGYDNVYYRAGFESGSQQGAYMIPCESSAGYGWAGNYKDCYCEGYKAGQKLSQ